MAGFTIDDKNLNELMARAVLTHLTPEKRDELMLQAVEKLFATPASNYDKRSMLVVEFEKAITRVAAEVADDVIRNSPDTVKRIRAAVEMGVKDLFDNHSQLIAKEVASAVQRALNIRI